MREGFLEEVAFELSWYFDKNEKGRRRGRQVIPK